jgi:hypothetical protein
MEHGFLDVITLLKEAIHSGEEQIEAANDAPFLSPKRHVQVPPGLHRAGLG